MLIVCIVVFLRLSRYCTGGGIFLLKNCNIVLCLIKMQIYCIIYLDLKLFLVEP